MHIALSLLIAISSILTISGKYTTKKLYYIFKPLSMGLIILYALFFTDYSTQYGNFIIIAFLFSFIGDLCLMFPEKAFKHGLVSFLIGHLIFSLAFTIGIDEWSILLVIPLSLYGLFFYRLLEDGLGKLRIPVIAYISIISIMGFTAINRYLAIESSSASFALFGALLFIISDSALAYNKFKKEFLASEIIILGTYFLAQYLFALSI